MKSLRGKFALLICVIAVCVCSLVGCGGGASNSNKLQSYYDAVVSSQLKLDSYADDIYQCWYDYIYSKKYSSVDAALLEAYTMNMEEVTFLEENDKSITQKYKDVKENDAAKEVMGAYSEYYEFVVNVSGSFSTYSANKETYKKALATALKKLSYEL